MLEPSPTRLRVFIADDHDIIRDGTCALIERQPGWEVCGVAKTGPQAVELACSLKPNVVVLDIDIPELYGLDAAKQIKRCLPETEVLIITSHTSDALISDVLEAGVKSFIDKAEADTYLLDAIESLSRHKPFFTEKVCEVLFSNIRARYEVERSPRLTAREQEIVQLLVEGKRNKEVADALGVSVRTVEVHRSSILHKLNLDSVAGLVRYAIRNMLVEP